jgi:hypothetical protein
MTLLLNNKTNIKKAILNKDLKELSLLMKTSKKILTKNHVLFSFYDVLFEIKEEMLMDLNDLDQFVKKYIESVKDKSVFLTKPRDKFKLNKIIKDKYPIVYNENYSFKKTISLLGLYDTWNYLKDFDETEYNRFEITEIFYNKMDVNKKRSLLLNLYDDKEKINTNDIIVETKKGGLLHNSFISFLFPQNKYCNKSFDSIKEIIPDLFEKYNLYDFLKEKLKFIGSDYHFNVFFRDLFYSHPIFLKKLNLNKNDILDINIKTKWLSLLDKDKSEIDHEYLNLNLNEKKCLLDFLLTTSFFKKKLDINNILNNMVNVLDKLIELDWSFIDHDDVLKNINKMPKQIFSCLKNDFKTKLINAFWAYESKKYNDLYVTRTDMIISRLGIEYPSKEHIWYNHLYLSILDKNLHHTIYLLGQKDNIDSKYKSFCGVPYEALINTMPMAYKKEILKSYPELNIKGIKKEHKIISNMVCLKKVLFKKQLTSNAQLNHTDLMKIFLEFYKLTNNGHKTNDIVKLLNISINELPIKSITNIFTSKALVLASENKKDFKDLLINYLKNVDFDQINDEESKNIIFNGLNIYINSYQTFGNKYMFDVNSWNTNNIFYILCKKLQLEKTKNNISNNEILYSTPFFLRHLNLDMQKHEKIFNLYDDLLELINKFKLNLKKDLSACPPYNKEWLAWYDKKMLTQTLSESGFLPKQRIKI